MSKAIDILEKEKAELEEAIELQTLNENYHKGALTKASERKFTLINERESILSAIEKLKGGE